MNGINPAQLQTLLLDTYDRLLSQDTDVEQLTRELSAALSTSADGSASPGSVSAKDAEPSTSAVPVYQQIIEQVRGAASIALPAGGVVAVVSKGDASLLQLDGHEVWHFPRAEDGAYAGHYPADSAEAIDHLEALRRLGVRFILFPCTAFWWLDHYLPFHRYLDNRYERIWADETCVIYRLELAASVEPPIDFLADLGEQLERVAQLEADVRASLLVTHDEAVLRASSIDNSIRGLQFALADCARAAMYTSSPPTIWTVGQTQDYTVTVTNTGGNLAGGRPVAGPAWCALWHHERRAT